MPSSSPLGHRAYGSEHPLGSRTLRRLGAEGAPGALGGPEGATRRVERDARVLSLSKLTRPEEEIGRWLVERHGAQKRTQRTAERFTSPTFLPASGGQFITRVFNHPWREDKPCTI